MAVGHPSKQQRTAFGSWDRISNLPKEAIDEIFKRMPIRDAIKTSTLSKSWRYKWMSMPDLVFDTRSIPLTKKGRTEANLVSFVSSVLLLHNGNISKFEINNFIESSCSAVCPWILVLSRTPLRHLVLLFNLSRSRSRYPVPFFLFFMLKDLRELELENCSLELPSQCKEFRCLTHLTLRSVRLTSRTIEKLVTLCPLLRCMKLHECKSLTQLNLNAPKLSLFSFQGWCERINFQHTPNLVTVTISTYHCNWMPRLFEACRLDEVLGGLAGIESLSIHYPFMEISSADSSPKRLQITYKSLKSVDLHVNFEDSKQIFAVLCLLRSSPYIEKLTLQQDKYELTPVLLNDENFWEGRLCKERNLLNHLKTVSLSEFEAMQHELDFVQFILLNAGVLETFTIVWAYDNQEEQQLLPMFEKMMQFKRASCQAKVVFSGLT